MLHAGDGIGGKGGITNFLGIKDFGGYDRAVSWIVMDAQKCKVEIWSRDVIKQEVFCQQSNPGGQVGCRTSLNIYKAFSKDIWQ
jgi:hypothetical protein